MNIFVVGSGKLATELTTELNFESVEKWRGVPSVKGSSLVIHAGSGRELDEVVSFCNETKSVLIEPSTGSALESAAVSFPVVLCPNINILMLKFMSFISLAGNMFKGNDIKISESHQSEKKSTPGTAVFIADSLGVAADQIVSIRNPDEQRSSLNIPNEHLSRHAVHQIGIRDEVCSISFESRVYGSSPYVSGVSQVLNVLESRKLNPRIYMINEFIEHGWL